MSLWSWFTGTADNDAQAAAIAAQEQAIKDSAAQHLAAGDITQDQANFADLFSDNAGPAVTDSFLNDLTVNDSAVPDTRAGVGDVIKDVAIVGGLVGGIWLFIKLGGGALTQRGFASKNKWVIGGVIAGAGLVIFLVYKYTRKAASDASDTASSVTSSFKSIFNLT